MVNVLDTIGTYPGQINSSILLSNTGASTSGGRIFSCSDSGPICTSESPVFAPLASSQASHSNSTPTTQYTPASLLFPTPTFPATMEYKDPNLTGCYAGTGGSTTFTLTSGDMLGVPGVSNGIITTIGSVPQTFNFSCSDFFGLDIVPWDLKLSFAKSPACASYARDIRDIASAQQTNHQIPYHEPPAGVENGDAHIPYECCGGCQFFVPEVEVLYWSTSSQPPCSQTNATISSIASLLPQSNEVQMPSNSNQSNLADFIVLEGSTLTFPSTYLVLRGAVSVTNECGIIGETYHNPTIAIPQGGLSTLSFSGTYIGFAGFEPQTGSFDPAACHTYGISNGSTLSFLINGDGTSGWTTTVSYTMGPPYNPILLPPPQLTALDPQWEVCTSWRNFGSDAYANLLGFLYDPPRALTQAPAMVDPSVTVPGPTPQPTQLSPQPAEPIIPAAPKMTDKPTNVADPSLPQDHSPDPVGSSAKPTFAADPSTPETHSADPAAVVPDSAAVADSGPSKNHSPDPVTPGTGLAGFILSPFQPIPAENGDEHSNADSTSYVKIISLNPSGIEPPILTIDGIP